MAQPRHKNPSASPVAFSPDRAEIGGRFRNRRRAAHPPEQYTRFASALFYRVRKGYDKSRHQNALTMLFVRPIIVLTMSDVRSEY